MTYTSAVESTHSISLLRQRMIDDMYMRKLSKKTQSGYIRAVKNFTGFFGRSPDEASAEDLRLFQLDMVSRELSSGTINVTITGLRFFFGVTLGRADVLAMMSLVYEPRKIPTILNPNEISQLLHVTTSMKYKTAFAVAY